MAERPRHGTAGASEKSWHCVFDGKNAVISGEQPCVRFRPQQPRDVDVTLTRGLRREKTTFSQGNHVLAPFSPVSLVPTLPLT